MRPSHDLITRRRFIRQGAGGVSALAVSGAALAASGGKDANPFAYDLSRVSKTDPKLIRFEELRRFRCPSPEPRRLAVGPQDRLYIAAKHGVSVFDREGARVNDLELPAPARCVAVAGDGEVYVGSRERLEVFDAKGAHRASWEPPGKKAWLSGLAAGENEVFVADSGNRVVLRYDRSGKFRGRIGEKNKERNVPGLVLPSPYLDVELGRDGLLRVNNPGRHRVETYTLNGDLELVWGRPSAAIDGFCGCCNPVGLALLPDGRFVTCEKGLPRVKVYATDGTFDCVVAGPESFPENARSCAPADCTTGGLDAATDSQGRIYILDLVTGEVRVMKAKV